MNIKQKIILKKLSLRRNGMKFSELMQGFGYEDKFPYHLKRLLLNKFIHKQKSLYFTTEKGLAESVTFDEDYNDVRYKLPQILLLCKHQDKYLIKESSYHTRKDQPNFCLPNIIATFGTSLTELIKSSLENKYLVKGKVSFKAVQDYHEFTSDNNLVFDDIFIVFEVLVSQILGVPSQHKWLSEKEILNSSSIHSTVKDFILEDKVKRFSERSVEVDYEPKV